MKFHDIKNSVQFFIRQNANFNGFVILVALVIAISWVSGTLSTIQTNFTVQRALNEKQQQLQLVQLEVELLKYQQNYYNSDEYKELEARDKLGLAAPGEKELILPENSAGVKALDEKDGAYMTAQPIAVEKTEPKSNFQQWIDFLTGKTAQARLQG